MKRTTRTASTTAAASATPAHPFAVNAAEVRFVGVFLPYCVGPMFRPALDVRAGGSRCLQCCVPLAAGAGSRVEYSAPDGSTFLTALCESDYCQGAFAVLGGSYTRDAPGYLVTMTSRRMAGGARA